MDPIPSLLPSDLAEALKGPNPPRLLDVRQPHELKISRLPNIVAIPLDELPERFEELDRDADWVVVCRTGGRSGHATQFLLSQGFPRVRNLIGGMNGYASDVDPEITQY